MASSEMDFVEDRLQLLDSWLEDQPDNDKLQEKREEYLELLEELNILTKKLKKVSKLLLEGDQQSTPLKLAKKQEQYSEEIEQILEYVDQDPLFVEAEMDPSDLLGVPLETLVEQPGMEGSSATLNFSVSDLPYMPPRSSRSLQSGSGNGSSANLDSGAEEFEELRPISEEQSTHFNSMGSLPSAGSAHSSASAGSFPVASAHSSLSVYDATTLKKKLKKVEVLLQNQQDMDRQQLKKLMKKRDEYSKALRDQGGGDDDENNSLDGKSMGSFAESSLATMDVSTSSLFRQSQGLGGGNSNPKKYDKRTLQKKLRKVKKLLQSTNDEEQLGSYRLKAREYEQALDEIASKDEGGSMSSFGESCASIPMNDLIVEMDEEERKHFKTLQKKLKKVVGLIEEAQEIGDERQTKKLRKKRDEYSAALEALTNR
jgi:hypothetical protein